MARAARNKIIKVSYSSYVSVYAKSCGKSQVTYVASGRTIQVESILLYLSAWLRICTAVWYWTRLDRYKDNNMIMICQCMTDRPEARAMLVSSSLNSILPVARLLGAVLQPTTWTPAFRPWLVLGKKGADPSSIYPSICFCSFPKRKGWTGRVYLHLVQIDIAFRSICCRIMYIPCRVQRTLCYSISGNRWCGWQIAVE